MKLLTETSDLNELNKLRMLFETNGVLILVPNEDSARLFSFLHPAGRYAIYVVYEEQYDDAVKLMQDENHVVEYKIDIETYQKELEKNRPNLASVLIDNALLVLIILILIIVAIVLIA